jgi:hypothetical protein
MVLLWEKEGGILLADGNKAIHAEDAVHGRLR